MKHPIAVSLILCLLPASAAGQPSKVPDDCAKLQSPRLTVIISDLHLGQGKASPYEDFRWSKALAGLLGHVRQRSQDRADLVIAGDLFELWQHPRVTCRERNKNYGCSVGQMETIARQVAEAHRADLEELGRFASAGNNRVIVVPGNHDAALMVDRVWDLVHPYFKASQGRVCRADKGTWESPDGAVVVEHGHQIGIDVNGFPHWPEVTGKAGKQEKMVKTWGEGFVQNLYNKVEPDYPLIDNVQPMTNALWNYLKKEGLVKAIPRDLARFIAFNAFSTSWSQKLTLGADDSGTPPWSEAIARDARRRGYRLIADALPDGDPMRDGLLAEPPAKDWRSTRDELTALVKDLPDEEVHYLCDQIDAQAKQSDTGTRIPCNSDLGGALLQHVIPESHRMETYLNRLHRDHRNLRLFVYGHTHSLRACWNVQIEDGTVVPIFNTGAFHRLVDKDMFTALAKSRKPPMTPKKALADLPLDQLPACYPVVIVDYPDGVPEGKLWNWYMEEGAASGETIPACDARCALINESLCSTEKGGLCAGVAP